MTIEEFIELLYEEFEDLEPGVLIPDTNFRDLDEWSSMHALILIAIVDTNFDLVLDGEDLSRVETIQELYDLIEQKTAED